jgi:hypothetical protein
MLEDPDYVPPDEGDYSEPGEYDSEYLWGGQCEQRLKPF